MADEAAIKGFPCALESTFIAFSANSPSFHLGVLLAVAILDLTELGGMDGLSAKYPPD